MSKNEMLLSCYRSGQMSAAQLLAHMKNDAEFSAYVKNMLKD